ncbi:MAG TPA: hypothetical protein VGN14_15240 [Candidatus Elarobacter sp.]|jgi:hypothetical protein
MRMYVSGASDTKEKRPDASVVAVADCDGLDAVTRADAIGLAEAASTIVPLRLPVVPARTPDVPWHTSEKNNVTAATLRFVRSERVNSISFQMRSHTVRERILDARKTLGESLPPNCTEFSEPIGPSKIPAIGLE